MKIKGSPLRRSLAALLLLALSGTTLLVPALDVGSVSGGMLTLHAQHPPHHGARPHDHRLCEQYQHERSIVATPLSVVIEAAPRKVAVVRPPQWLPRRPESRSTIQSRAPPPERA